jgi:hypothetical protein
MRVFFTPYQPHYLLARGCPGFAFRPLGAIAYTLDDVTGEARHKRPIASAYEHLRADVRTRATPLQNPFQLLRKFLVPARWPLAQDDCKPADRVTFL